MHRVARRRCLENGRLIGVGLGSRSTWKTAALWKNAKIMAAHAPVRTTQLYDRRRDDVTLDEVVKINIRV